MSREVAVSIAMNRIKRKLTEKQLAKMMGVNEKDIRNWEAAVIPPLEVVIKMASIFNIKLWEFFAPVDTNDKLNLTKEEKTLLDTFIKIPRDKARDAMLNYLSIIAHQDIVKRIYKEAKANYKKGILPKTDDLC